MKRSLLVLVLVLLCSCVGGAQQADRLIDVFAEVLSKSEPIVRSAYEKEIEACPDRECVERVSLEWDPVIEAYDKANEIWCSIVPDGEGC